MTTLDLTILNKDSRRYVVLWRGVRKTRSRYRVGARFFQAVGEDHRSDLWFQIHGINMHALRGTLRVLLRNGHRHDFPLNEVPIRSPFKKRELVEIWDQFIGMFDRPVEIENQHESSGYE